MPYGYKVVDRKIVIDETKAETERIFPMVQYELEVVLKKRNDFPFSFFAVIPHFNRES